MSTPPRKPSRSPRPTRRQSLTRPASAQPPLPPGSAHRAASASAVPGPPGADTPGTRLFPPRAASANSTAAAGGAPRFSVGGIRRDLRAAQGGTPLRPASQVPTGTVGRSAAQRSQSGRNVPRSSRLSFDTTVGDLFPVDQGGGGDAARTPARGDAVRTPATNRTPRSAIGRASESRRPLARRSTIRLGAARMESPFDLLWRLAHPRPSVDFSLLETTVEEPGLETEVDMTAGGALVPQDEQSALLHPGPPIPGDLTHAALPRTSSSRSRQSGQANSIQDQGEDDEQDQGWGTGMDQMDLPSTVDARAALNRVLARTPRGSMASLAGQKGEQEEQDSEGERERDRLAEEELTRLLAVDPNDFSTMSAALARRLSTHARIGDTSRSTTGPRTPSSRLSPPSEDEEMEAGDAGVGAGDPRRADQSRRSERSMDETELGRRAAPPRTSLGATLAASEPDEAAQYGLGDWSDMPSLEDAPNLSGQDPSLPYLSRDDVSIPQDSYVGGETQPAAADQTGASVTRMLNVTGVSDDDDDQEGQDQRDVNQPEYDDQLGDLLPPEAGSPAPATTDAEDQERTVAEPDDDATEERAIDSDEASWASDHSAGGILRQRLSRRSTRTRRQRDQVPASLVTRLFSAIAGSNYRLDPDALAGVQDASDAFFGALARDVAAAASARTTRRFATRTTTVTETDLLAALVAHGHVDARHDVYTTALTLLPRELSDWIDVARVEPQRRTVRRATQAARATNQAAAAAAAATARTTEVDDPETDQSGAVRAPGTGNQAKRSTAVNQATRPPMKARPTKSKPTKPTATAGIGAKRPASTSSNSNALAGPSKRPRGVPGNPLAAQAHQPRNKPKATRDGKR